MLLLETGMMKYNMTEVVAILAVEGDTSYIEYFWTGSILSSRVNIPPRYIGIPTRSTNTTYTCEVNTLEELEHREMVTSKNKYKVFIKGVHSVNKYLMMKELLK